jgi:protein-S-isoprenylcysteine O-methyltransferase Ste14
MRWSNVPVPEAHVAAIAGSAVLHTVLPLRLSVDRRTGLRLGGPMVAAGVGLSAWAVASAGDADVERESALVTHGAYAVSRNPMYVGWSTAVLGVALGTRSAWLVAAWLVAVTSLDREVDAEESRLLDRFGAEYAAYRERVPRYLGRLWSISLDGIRRGPPA